MSDTPRAADVEVLRALLAWLRGTNNCRRNSEAEALAIERLLAENEALTASARRGERVLHRCHEDRHASPVECEAIEAERDALREDRARLDDAVARLCDMPVYASKQDTAGGVWRVAIGGDVQHGLQQLRAARERARREGEEE